MGEKVSECVSGVSLFNINANNYCCQFASQKAEYPESLPNNLPSACALFSPPLTDCLLSVSVESFSGNFIRKNNATAPIQCIVVSAMMMMMRREERKKARERENNIVVNDDIVVEIFIYLPLLLLLLLPSNS